MSIYRLKMHIKSSTAETAKFCHIPVWLAGRCRPMVRALRWRRRELNICTEKHMQAIRRSQYEARIKKQLPPPLAIASLSLPLNPAPKCPILRSNNKKNYGEGLVSPSQTLPPAGRGTPSPHLTHLGARAPAPRLSTPLMQATRRAYAHQCWCPF